MFGGGGRRGGTSAVNGGLYSYSSSSTTSLSSSRGQRGAGSFLDAGGMMMGVGGSSSNNNKNNNSSNNRNGIASRSSNNNNKSTATRSSSSSACMRIGVNGGSGNGTTAMNEQQAPPTTNGGAGGGGGGGQRGVRFPSDLDYHHTANSNNHYRGLHQQQYNNSSATSSGGGTFYLLERALGMLSVMLATVCILGLLTILAVLYLTVRPFSRALYRRLSTQLGASSFLDAMALLLPNTTIYLSGDSDVPSPVGTSFWVSNHLVDGDWWCLFMLGRCVGLRGTMKAFLRNECLQINNKSNNNNTRRDNYANGPTSDPDDRENHRLLQFHPPPPPQQQPAASPIVTAPRSISASAVTTNGGTNGGSPPSPSCQHNNHRMHHPHPHINGSNSNTTTMMTTSAVISQQQQQLQEKGGITMFAKLVHFFLEFPLIDGEDTASDREQLFQLLRSFATENHDHHNPKHQQQQRSSSASSNSTTTTNNNTANTNGGAGSGGASSSSNATNSGITAPVSVAFSAPVHLLFFPEGWSLHNGCGSHATGRDRRSILAKSNEFAQRERRPQLKHLLLPRTRGFNASLDCLRDSCPLVYDVTMTHSGYDGSLPPAMKLSLSSLWDALRIQFPREIHIRIKRYSMEEVLQDTSWLDKKWAEKDRLLSHFARHGTFPIVDNRGYSRRPLVFSTRHYSLETSLVSLIRLLLVPCAVPILLLLSIPLFWTLLCIWMTQYAFRYVSSRFMGMDDNGGIDGVTAGNMGSSTRRRRRPSSNNNNGNNSDTNNDGTDRNNDDGQEHDHKGDDDDDDDDVMMGGSGQTPGSASAAGTPFVPATPFVTPSTTSWR